MKPDLLREELGQFREALGSGAGRSCCWFSGACAPASHKAHGEADADQAGRVKTLAT